MRKLTRRAFARLSATTAVAPLLSFRPLKPGMWQQDDKLQSAFLLDLSLDTEAPRQVGTATSGRLLVPVSGGTFDGPRLKGTVVSPAGDWMVERADGSRVLDVRVLFRTDDGEMIYVSWRGIAYTPPGAALFARIVPVFETGAPKYAWLNNVIAVGVYRPSVGKVAYRVYQIL
jgi:hypothetical protein